MVFGININRRYLDSSLLQQVFSSTSNTTNRYNARLFSCAVLDKLAAGTVVITAGLGKTERATAEIGGTTTGLKKLEEQVPILEEQPLGYEKLEEQLTGLGGLGKKSQ